MTDCPKYQHDDAPSPGDVPADVVISSDTQRAARLPPRQSRTKKWPVRQADAVAQISQADWRLEVNGLVEAPLVLPWSEFQALPRTRMFGDFHCVERWSRLGNLWEGVAIGEILARVAPRAEAKFAIVHASDGSWATNLPLADIAGEDVLLADMHDGEPLDSDHGGPVRLVVPRLYAWKSAKWIRRIEFVAEDRSGFWERAGYHPHGDPWQEERFDEEGPLA